MGILGGVSRKVGVGNLFQQDWKYLIKNVGMELYTILYTPSITSNTLFNHVFIYQSSNFRNVPIVIMLKLEYNIFIRI